MSLITASLPKTNDKFRCDHCGRVFQRENSYAIHMCEPKRRYLERDERGVQLGFWAFLRSFEIMQGSARLKTFDDFAQSPYYRAFVKFGRYCVNTHVIASEQFVTWLVRNNKKLDHWCSDAIYGEYLAWYVLIEAASDAVKRAQAHALDWSERQQAPAHDYLRYGNRNEICYSIVTGRISAWILYNTQSGQHLLADLLPEQLAMIWSMIDADQWQKKFRDYPADQEYVRETLTSQGW